jgi:hypothetical protein
MGVIFIRFDTQAPPQVVGGDGDQLSVTVKDHILGRPIEINPELLILATAVRPNENKDLFELFKVPINAEGFLVEAHAKLRPVDFGSEGIFMAGLAHYPKSIDETIAQAQAAVSRAATVLSKAAIWWGRGGRGQSGPLRGLPDLRAHLPVPCAVHRRGGLCGDRAGRLPGLRLLRGGMPGQGHHPETFYRPTADRQDGAPCLPSAPDAGLRLI